MPSRSDPIIQYFAVELFEHKSYVFCVLEEGWTGVSKPRRLVQRGYLLSGARTVPQQHGRLRVLP
jgi:hypothetical protein